MTLKDLSDPKGFLHVARRALERSGVRLTVDQYAAAQDSIVGGRALHFHSKPEGECYAILHAPTGVYWGAVLSKQKGIILTAIQVPADVVANIRKGR